MRPDEFSTDDFGSDQPPPTLSQGDLSPPPRKPPTAVSAAPIGPEHRLPRPRITRRSPIPREIARAVDTALDILDDVGDAIRVALARAVR